MVGALRWPRRPLIPIEVGFPSVKACAGSWHVLQATLPSADKRPSKNSCWPSAIFSGVCGLSGGIAAGVASAGAPTCLGRASGPASGIGGISSVASGVAPRISVTVPTAITNARRTRPLFVEHRPAFMGHEQVVHVVRMLLLLRQNPFEEHPGGRIPVAEVAHHLAVGLDGDAFGNQIFLDHVDQVLALGVLRGGPGADPLRVQVRLAAELIDSLGEEIEMLLFLLRVLSELFLDRLAGESGRADGVELVSKDAHDLRGDRVVQEGDGIFHLAPVVLRDGAFAQMLPSPAPNLLDIRKEPLSSTHCLSSLLHDDPFPEAPRAVAPASHPPPTAL